MKGLKKKASTDKALKDGPTICLNMIVKNESKILQRMFTSVLSVIDCYCICDTGSTDGTIDFIKKFFKEHNIPGKVVEEPFINFCHNRNVALQHCSGMSTYALLLDADMILQVGNFNKSVLDPKFDSFTLLQGNEAFSYQNTRIVRNNGTFKYTGVTHEYISAPKNNNANVDKSILFINDIGDGGAKQHKFERDIQLLTQGIKDEPDNTRYHFYLANSYRDSNKHVEAIVYYKKLLEFDTAWHQEKYLACLNIYECYTNIKREHDGLVHLVDAYKWDNTRIECIYRLVKYYCCKDMNDIAFMYYTLIQSYFENKFVNDNVSVKLFAKYSEYAFYLPYYMIIVSDKVKKHHIGIKMYKILFDKKFTIVSQWWMDNIIFNLQFFIDKVDPGDAEFFKSCENYLNAIHEAKFTIKPNLLHKYIEYGLNRSNLKMLSSAVTPSSSPQVNTTTNIVKKCTSKKILFYVGFSSYHWNLTYRLNNSLGGSETAVAYLSTYFDKSFDIYIGGDVIEEQVDNITYVSIKNLSALIDNNTFHTIIVSRYIGFFEMFPTFRAGAVHLWAHDTSLLPYGCSLNNDEILAKWSPAITKCVMLTEWHKNEYAKLFKPLENKFAVINNGIKLDLFQTAYTKVKNRFIFTSRPERGLKQLLLLWNDICAKIPGAELKITSYKDNYKEKDLNEIKELMGKVQNVEVVGQLNPVDLYSLMASAEYWVFPSLFCETSCITALEMLYSEVVCFYYPIAGICETIGECGIKLTPNNEVNTIVEAIEDQSRMDALRSAGKTYAAGFSWENKAKEWHEQVVKLE